MFKPARIFYVKEKAMLEVATNPAIARAFRAAHEERAAAVRLGLKWLFRR